MINNQLSIILSAGSKKGPTAAEEFADFLHVCQAGLVVACLAGVIGSLALLVLICRRFVVKKNVNKVGDPLVANRRVFKS